MTRTRIIKEIHKCNSKAFGGGEIGKERQEKLYDLRVAVVGTDLLGQMVLGCLYGLGVGNISFFDDSSSIRNKEKWFLYGHTKNIVGKKKSDLVYEALKQINPESKTYRRHGKFNETFIYHFNPHIVIDTTNDVISKENVLKYAFGFNSKSVPIISLASDNEKSAITCYWPKNKGNVKILKENPNLEVLLHKEFGEELQGGFTSGIVAGLSVEEVRKFAFQYDDEDKKLESNNRLVYNIHSSNRIGIDSDLKRNNIPLYRKKKVLVVGAGALGNWVSIYLSQIGLGQVDFLDYDIAEVKNLNRQIQLRGRLNEEKAKILSERLQEIDPYVKSRSYIGKLCDELSREDKAKGLEKINSDILLNQEYDIILGCLDNKYGRIWLNNFSIKNKISYIDGGSHPKEGQLAVYIPGITKSVDEQLDLRSFPEERSNSCTGPNPSVVMSNAIIAAAMVGELIHVFDYSLNKRPLEGPFNYSTSLPQRFYIEKRMER